MNSRELLDAADDLITRTDRDTAGLWPRTSAFLIRMALERVIGDIWVLRGVALRESSMAAQLISLPTYTSPELARRLRATWGALSEACHHHPYELAPTATQLRSWLSEVAAAIGDSGTSITLTSASGSDDD